MRSDYARRRAELKVLENLLVEGGGWSCWGVTDLAETGAVIALSWL